VCARAGFSERTADASNATHTLKGQIAHGRTVSDPLERYWEKTFLSLLEMTARWQGVTLFAHFKAHSTGVPDDRISGHPGAGGCGMAGSERSRARLIFRRAGAGYWAVRLPMVTKLGVNDAQGQRSAPALSLRMVYSAWEHVGVVSWWGKLHGRWREPAAAYGRLVACRKTTDDAFPALSQLTTIKRRNHKRYECLRRPLRHGRQPQTSVRPEKGRLESRTASQNH